jgi:hypothetical protein
VSWNDLVATGAAQEEIVAALATGQTPEGALPILLAAKKAKEKKFRVVEGERSQYHKSIGGVASCSICASEAVLVLLRRFSHCEVVHASDGGTAGITATFDDVERIMDIAAMYKKKTHLSMDDVMRYILRYSSSLEVPSGFDEPRQLQLAGHSLRGLFRKIQGLGRPAGVVITTSMQSISVISSPQQGGWTLFDSHPRPGVHTAAAFLSFDGYQDLVEYVLRTFLSDDESIAQIPEFNLLDYMPLVLNQEVVEPSDLDLFAIIKELEHRERVNDLIEGKRRAEQDCDRANAQVVELLRGNQMLNTEVANMQHEINVLHQELAKARGQGGFQQQHGYAAHQQKQQNGYGHQQQGYAHQQQVFQHQGFQQQKGNKGGYKGGSKNKGGKKSYASATHGAAMPTSYTVGSKPASTPTPVLPPFGHAGSTAEDLERQRREDQEMEEAQMVALQMEAQEEADLAEAKRLQNRYEEDERQYQIDAAMAKSEEQALILCVVCYMEQPEGDKFTVATCPTPDDEAHFMCRFCANRFFLAKINTNEYPIRCAGCTPIKVEEGQELPGICHQDEVLNCLLPEDQERYNKMEARKTKEMYGVTFCRKRDCEGCAQMDPGVVNFVCPECSDSFCTACDDDWHAGCTCDEYQANLLENAKQKDADVSALDRQTRRCPGKCRIPVHRFSDCYHITCPSQGCGTHWCWGCGMAFAKEVIYDHMGACSRPLDNQ